MNGYQLKEDRIAVSKTLNTIDYAIKTGTIMKHENLLITLLAVAAFAVGCNKEQTTAQQIDKVQTETKEAAQDMKDYTYAQKSAFVETMQAQLAALDRGLDRRCGKGERSSGDLKAEGEPTLLPVRG